MVLRRHQRGGKATGGGSLNECSSPYILSYDSMLGRHSFMPFIFLR